MSTKYCPKCRQTFPSPQRLCTADGEVLSFRDPYHLVGRVLSEKYRIDALVGLGGMGAVYCAHHLVIDRRVAFKILQPNIATGDENVVRMFEREAKLSGRLSHENIVDIKDAGSTDDGISYIVMEWLDGHTLDEELQQRGKLGFGRAAFIARQIAVALTEAHRNQIIHRDLKPGNVMLVRLQDGREQVKVLDFGISKALNSTSGTPVTSLVGTPHYASLEQMTVGEKIDARADLYSLGVILYRMLGGQVPFRCNSMGELIKLQMTDTPQPIASLRPEIPRELDRLISRMIAREPAARPSNALEVISVLDRVIDQVDLSTAETAEITGAFRSGETTIQRKALPADPLTESLSRASPGGGARTGPADYSTAVMPQAAAVPGQSPPSIGRLKSVLLAGPIVMILLAAGAYWAYRFKAAKPNAVPLSSTASSIAPGISQPAAAPSEQPVAALASPRPAASVKPALPLPATPKQKSKPPQPEPPSAVVSEPSPMPRPESGRPQFPDPKQRAETHYRLAKTFYEQSRFPAAMRETKIALRLNPNHGEARELMRKLRSLHRILNDR